MHCASLLILVAARSLRLSKDNGLGEDNAADDLERQLDDEARVTFEPSSSLARNWIEAITAFKQFAQVFQSTSMIPNQCKEDIRQGKRDHFECADPWPKTKNCKAPYEIPNYRLGDLFYEVHGAHDKEGPAGNQRWTKFYFPESIGAQYLAWKTKTHDKEALCTVLDSRKYANFERPSNDTVVVHFRAFDIYAFGAQNGYTLASEWYDHVAKQAKLFGKTKAMIISGDHWLTQRLNGVVSPDRSSAHLSGEKLKKAVEASKTKAIAIQASFIRQGFSVNERSNGNADCDFLYMSNAHLFVPSRGNFGGVAAAMVELKGGTVLRAPRSR